MISWIFTTLVFIGGFLQMVSADSPRGDDTKADQIRRNWRVISHYNSTADTNDLIEIEQIFSKATPGRMSYLKKLKVDENSTALLIRSLRTEDDASFKWMLLIRLEEAAESEALLQALTDVVLKSSEGREARETALASLCKRHSPAVEKQLRLVFEEIGNSHLRQRLLVLCEKTNKQLTVELAKSLKEKDPVSYMQYEHMSAEVARESKPETKPNKEEIPAYLLKPRPISPDEAASKLKDYSTFSENDKLSLVVRIATSRITESNVVSRINALMPHETNSLARSYMIDTVVGSKSSPSEAVDYLKNKLAEEKNPEVKSYIQLLLNLMRRERQGSPAPR